MQPQQQQPHPGMHQYAPHHQQQVVIVNYFF
jgi:hypothetical protein